MTAVHFPRGPLPQGPPPQGPFPRVLRLRRVPVRRALCLLPLVLVGVLAVRKWPVLAEGFGQLRTARRPWLVAAAGATCLTWVAVAVTRQGPVVERLPRLRLLATGHRPPATAMNPQADHPSDPQSATATIRGRPPR